MIDYYDKNGTPMSLMEWCKVFEDKDYKRIALYQGIFVDVSTVWLGLDHNFGGGLPIIFETMVFTKRFKEVDCRRYHTIEEAKQGHIKMVKQYRWRIDLLFRRI